MAGQKQRPPGRKDANYFCEYCQVWMANHATVKQKHENGGKHKAAVAAKIRGMKEKEKAASREAAHNKAAMEAIEREAAEKYQESDRSRETKGTWSSKSRPATITTPCTAITTTRPAKCITAARPPRGQTRPTYRPWLGSVSVAVVWGR